MVVTDCSLKRLAYLAELLFFFPASVLNSKISSILIKWLLLGVNC